MRALAIVVVAAACGKSPPPVDRDQAGKLFDEIVLDVPPGESDLTLDDHGKIWAIAERDRVASEIELHGLTAKVTAHPVDGVPAGNDTEAITWLGGTKFALGIEGQEEPTAGILFAELRPDGHLVVTGTRMLTSDEMGVELQNNHGAEAICGKGDDLVVGIEERGRFPDGTRWAPLVRIKNGQLALAKLHLTSDTGKLSAMDCHFADDGSIDILGIERHYGVERILHATLAAGATDVKSTIELDLGPVIHDTYNLEGIVRLADGRWVLVNDNQSKTIDGPTKLLVFKPRPAH
jgi:hypothetical protein